MESIKKQMGESKLNDFEVTILPVKAFLCKTECQNLLNQLIMVQAFYNNINLTTLAGLSKTQTG